MFGTSPQPIETLGRPHKRTIYAAGKISREDWRWVIFNNTHRPAGAYGDEDLWNPRYRQDCGRFFYGGPFFCACDHGCAHAPNRHAAEGCTLVEAEGYEQEYRKELDALHRRVWAINHHRLTNADIILAYINEMNCFGTLIELGRAAELGKTIALVLGNKLTDEKVGDLWMATMPATKVYRGAIENVWSSFVGDFL